MSVQVSDINSVGPINFKLIELSGSEKPLPPVNSIVTINILEKVKDGYKILVNGKLFYSKFPVNVSINDILLAKVQSHHPFILALDNLASQKGLDEVLSFLISKLDLPSTNQTEKILRSFLLNRKPLIKSRLEKLSELLGSQVSEFDDEQLNDIVNLVGSGEFTSDSVISSLVGLYKHKSSGIPEMIMNLIQEINQLLPSHEIVKELNSVMVVNLDNTDSIDLITIKKHFNKVSELFRFICKVWDNMPSGKAGILFKELIDKILIYYFQKALTPASGNYPSFIIIKINGKLELLHFDIGSDNNTYSFNLNMNPDNMGRMHAHGFFKENKLSLGIRSLPETKSFLQQNRENLENRLRDNVRCRYDINFFCGDMEDPIPSSVRSRKVNATY